MTVAASHDDDIDDEEQYQREVKLKMELLREHMKEYVGEDFSYRGTAIQAAIAGAVNRILPNKKEGE